MYYVQMILHFKSEWVDYNENILSTLVFEIYSLFNIANILTVSFFNTFKYIKSIASCFYLFSQYNF